MYIVDFKMAIISVFLHFGYMVCTQVFIYIDESHDTHGCSHLPVRRGGFREFSSHWESNTDGPTYTTVLSSSCRQREELDFV